MELTTCPNHTQGVQTMEEPLKDWVAWCEPMGSRAASLHPSQDCVVHTFVFSSRLSCVVTCHPCCPTPLLLAQDLLTANDSTVSFLLLSLVNSTTFFMPPFSNSHLLLLNWKDSRYMRMMSPFKVLFASFTTCVQPRFT